MKALFLALAFLASAANAQTSTVEWWLRSVGGPDIAPYATQALCDSAAKARPATPGTSTTYDCPRRLKVTAACPAKPANDTQPGVCPVGQIVVTPWTVTRSYVTAPAPICWTAGAWSPSTPPVGACSTPTAQTWTRIASENEAFTVGTGQTVRFGRSPGPYVQKVMTGLGQCSLDFFGSDPAPGQGKFCEVLDGSGTPVVVVPPPPPPPTTLGSATVSWTPPTKNADGTPLTDLAGYAITCSRDSTMTVMECQYATPASVTTQTIDNLPAGTWYFQVRALDTSRNASAPGNTVSKTVP